MDISPSLLYFTNFTCTQMVHLKAPRSRSSFLRRRLTCFFDQLRLLRRSPLLSSCGIRRNDFKLPRIACDSSLKLLFGSSDLGGLFGVVVELCGSGILEVEGWGGIKLAVSDLLGMGSAVGAEQTL